MVHSLSLLYKQGIPEFKDNYAHVIIGIMKHSQGTMKCYNWSNDDFVQTIGDKWDQHFDAELVILTHWILSEF
jgi:hypothetical protein